MANWKGISVKLNITKSDSFSLSDCRQPDLLDDKVLGKSGGKPLSGSAVYSLSDFDTDLNNLTLIASFDRLSDFASGSRGTSSSSREKISFDEYFTQSSHFRKDPKHWDQIHKMKFKFFYTVASQGDVIRSNELVLEERNCDDLKDEYQFNLFALEGLEKRLRSKDWKDFGLDVILMTVGLDGKNIVRCKFKLVLRNRNLGRESDCGFLDGTISNYKKPRSNVSYGRQGSPPRSTSTFTSASTEIKSPSKVSKTRYDGYAFDSTSGPTQRPAQYDYLNRGREAIATSSSDRHRHDYSERRSRSPIRNLSDHRSKFYKDGSDFSYSLTELPNRSQIRPRVADRSEVEGGRNRERNESPDRWRREEEDVLEKARRENLELKERLKRLERGHDQRYEQVVHRSHQSQLEIFGTASRAHHQFPDYSRAQHYPDQQSNRRSYNDHEYEPRLYH